MVFNFYYIDVVSSESLAEFQQRLEMITLDMLRAKMADTECQLIVTTNQSLFCSRSDEKLIILDNKLFVFNARYALTVRVFSPLTTFTMHAIFIMPMRAQDVTGLGALYLILNYVQTFVSKYQHHGVNFHFYGSEQQVKMLSAVFCDHGTLTNVLIPQCITLCLHAWFEPLKGFLNKHVIKGACDVQLDYKPMLSLFSTVVKQLPTNLFVHSNEPQLTPPTADVEPPTKRIKSSTLVESKSTEIVFPMRRSNGARADLCDKNNQSVVQLTHKRVPELNAQLTAKLNVGGGGKAKKWGTFFSSNDQTASISANEGQNVSYHLEKN